VITVTTAIAPTRNPNTAPRTPTVALTMAKTETVAITVKAATATKTVKARPDTARRDDNEDRSDTSLESSGEKKPREFGANEKKELIDDGFIFVEKKKPTSTKQNRPRPKDPQRRPRVPPQAARLPRKEVRSDLICYQQ
jgi:hypothetical protein